MCHNLLEIVLGFKMEENYYRQFNYGSLTSQKEKQGRCCHLLTLRGENRVTLCFAITVVRVQSTETFPTTPSFHNPDVRQSNCAASLVEESASQPSFKAEILLFVGYWTYKKQSVSCNQGPVSWGPTTVKWRQFSQSTRHSTIGTRQNEYHEALSSSVNVQSHLTSSFADDGNASWYSVCRVPMVEWRLDCENCRHLTVISPRSA